MYRAHLVHKHGRAERLVRHALVAEYRLDLILSPAQRNNDVRVIVQMKILNLAGFEIDFPDAHVVVLEHDALPDFAKLDTFFGCRLETGLVTHDARPYCGSTAM